MIYGKVESVTKIEHLGEELDYCNITIDFDEKKIFGDYTALCEFVGKYVEYSVCRSMHNNEQIEVVVNLCQKRVIQTLEKSEDIMLLPPDSDTFRESISKFDIKSVPRGEYLKDGVAFLSKFERNVSNLSQWFVLTFVDCKARMFTARLFESNDMSMEELEDLVDGLVGRYVRFDIYNTAYGYRIEYPQLYNVPVTAPPEVETAVAIIEQAVAGDEALVSYMQATNFIETLKKVIDGELGYNLVRIATELTLIKAMQGVSRLYDYKLMVRAAIASRGYLLGAKTHFSRATLNTNRVIRTQLKEDKELLLILDVFSEEEASPTKNAYIEVRKFADRLVDERRGLYEEVSNSGVIDSIRASVGGLL